jgi:membrane fusion protein, heavy metal efflux system
MARLSCRPFTHYVRIVAVACAAAAAMLLLGVANALAHEGHDHGAETQAGTGVPTSPRVVATSESYQFVGIVEGEVLVIYLDRAEDNSPVAKAQIEVSLGGEPLKAEPQERTDTYELTSPLLRTAGSHEVLITISDGNANDLLVGTLIIPATNSKDRARQWPIAYVIGFPLLILAATAALMFGRRKLLFAVSAAASLAIVSTLAWAHEGHDHGPDLSASSGNSPSRRPDGTIFLPKPSQRLLEVRTLTARVETKIRTVRFNGRIVANPNRSGMIQSTIQGRYEAPEGGVPALGTRVKVGDLLGRVAPSFASIDTSDMAQTLGTLDQEIALNRSKLARQEHLLRSNVVAKATVEDTRIQLEGLEKRRRELLAAKARPEELRAPVDGVIAATRVVAGQVVAQSDQLFQIIDPASLLVEALVFDQINPDAVDEATAAIGADTVVKLKFLGRSRALQQQYAILLFQIMEAHNALNVGTPATVIAPAGQPVTGILLPQAALAQAANGQTVVFTQKEPEIFIPRHVRIEPFDSQSVLITGGLTPGEKVVVRNASLVNQVR